jgi:hypothetical protein
VARSAGLEPATFSVCSHSPSQTGRDTGRQGETKQRFYQVVALVEVQGETPSCGQIAVKSCARKRNFPGDIERVPEREGPAYAVAYAFTSPSTLVECKIVTLLQGLMPTLLIGGGLPPGVSKLVNVAEYRHFDFGMSFGTDTPAKMPEFGGEREVRQKRTFLRHS